MKQPIPGGPDETRPLALLRPLEKTMEEISETAAEIRRLRMLQSRGEAEDAVLVLTIQELTARVDRLYEQKRAWHTMAANLRVQLAGGSGGPQPQRSKRTEHTAPAGDPFADADNRMTRIAG